MGMKQDTPSGLWCYCLGQSWCSALCALLFTQMHNNLLLNEFENNLYAYNILFVSLSLHTHTHRINDKQMWKATCVHHIQVRHPWSLESWLVVSSGWLRDGEHLSDRCLWRMMMFWKRKYLYSTVNVADAIEFVMWISPQLTHMYMKRYCFAFGKCYYKFPLMSKISLILT
jgi:hypothetical protein